MKKIYSQNLAVYSLFLMFFGLSFTVNSQVIKPFKERTSSYTPNKKIYNVKGNFTMIGNTNLTLQDYSNTSTNGNNQMVYVDVDNQNSTFNSSSATLRLLADNGTELTNCYNIVYAGLYWTGRVSDSNSSETFTATKGNSSKTLNKRKVLLRKGTNPYVEFTAGTNDIYFPTTGDGRMFTAYAEVTDYVRNNGIGEYFVADIAALQGSGGGDIGKYAGWGLVVIYENSNLKNRDITVFDGHAYVRESQTLSYDINVSGFNSVATGPVGIKLGIMAGEGDVNYDGDYFQIRKTTTNNYLSLSRTGNSTDNFFNSSINTGGNARNPNLTNNSGIDISMFELPNSAKDIIGNNQTSTTFRYGSTIDTYTIFSIVMAVDAYVPEIEGVLTATTINGSPAGAGPYTVLPGQELGYKIQIKNRGSEAIQNSKVVIPIPYNATFVNGSLAKTINFTPAPTPNSLTYEPTLGANGSIVWDIGTLPLPSDPNTVLGELTFKLKSTENCALLKNSNCSNVIQVNGVLSGKGANSTVTVTDKPLILGYTTSGSCTGTTIPAPLLTTIDSANYTNANCQSTPATIAFTFCNGASSIPITDVSGSFPPGSTFYNAYPVVAGTTTQYTINNPFPATAGTSTYYAVPPGAASDCYFQFTITVETITTMPTVTSPVNYCINDVAVPLTAVPSKPEYTLYYYETANSTAQQSLTPSTTTTGQFTYYVAEGKTNACIGPKKAIVVNVYAKPTVVITNPLPICAPANTLDLTAAAITSGSTSGLTYTYWTDAGATIAYANYTAAIPGTYYIKGTNPTTNCFDIKPVVVTKTTVTVTELTASHVDVKCFNQSTGSITINNATGGVGSYTYDWADLAGTNDPQVRTGLPAGTYTVTAKDSNGCASAPLIIIITQPAAAVTVAKTQTDVLCFGATTGAIDITASGGVGPYTYDWADLAGINDPEDRTNLAQGTYTVTVKDANGCTTAPLAITITQPASALAVAKNSQTDVLCFGATTGAIDITASGGVGPYTYDWADLAGTNDPEDRTNLAQGTYTVTVKDANGCTTAPLAVTITQPASALAVAKNSQTDVLCFGAATGAINITASGGVGPYTYDWADLAGANDPEDRTNLTEGTYTVTVKDANGCTTAPLAVTITQPASGVAVAKTSQTDVLCFGAATGAINITASGGVGPYTYDWADLAGINDPEDRTNLTEGTYTVTVKDANGCTTAPLAVTITQPASGVAVAKTSQTDVLCFGAATGAINITASGGVGPYTYDWADLAGINDPEDRTNLTEGTYTVTVKDANGCTTAPLAVTITQPASAVAVAKTSQTDVLCFGAATGAINITASGGVGPYTYDWADLAGVNDPEDRTNLTEGTYTVTVKDSKGCSSAPLAVTITEPASAVAVAKTSQTDVLCFGAATGAINITASGGVGPYTYDWADLAGTNDPEDRTNLAQGTYTVTVKDANGCTTAPLAVTITQPASALAVAKNSQTDVLCFGAATGAIDITASGGVGPYTYDWADLAGVNDPEDRTNLTEGTYTVTVKDANGCTTAPLAVTITQPASAVAVAKTSQTDVLCFGAATGAINITASGGVGPYTYDWADLAGVNDPEDRTNLTEGTYTVTVKDANGCTTAPLAVTITQPASSLAVAKTSQTDVLCFGAATGAINITASGGVGPYTYDWADLAGTNDPEDRTNLAQGTYTVTVKDANGCTTAPLAVTITEPASAVAVAKTSQTDVLCFGAATGAINITASGGVGPYTYDWADLAGVNDPEDRTNLIEGTYTVTVKDANGCTTAPLAITITQPGSALSCSVVQNKPVTANGLSNGEATVTAIGGTPGYTYLWDNGETTQKAVALDAGTHSVTVKDANGCTTECTVVITEPNVLSCSISQDSAVKCFGGNTGKATVTAVGGNGDYTYAWDNGETTAQAVALTAGLHSVTVTDKLGYTTKCTVTITQPQNALSAVKSQTDVTCGAGNNGSATVTVSGGTAQYSYSWNTVPVQTTATASNLAAGNYTVLITDANGCTLSESFTILDGDSVKPIVNPLPETTTINCPAEPVFAEATATDNNGTIASLTYEDTIVQGNCAGAYTKTRTWIAKDSCGNVSLPVSQTIIVQDNTAPTWTTQAGALNVTLECNDTQGLATAQATFPTASDACDTDVTNITKVSGQFVAYQGCGNAGTYTNTWTVKDDCGNTSETFTQVITIQDTTAPTWTTLAETLNATLECSDAQGLAAAQAQFPTASDLCDADVSNITKVSGQFVASESCSNAGTYTNTWTVKDDCGNTSETFTQVITIQDTTAPTWTTLAGTLNVTLECSDAQGLAAAQAQFPIASDLCDADVSNITKVSGQFVASESCSNAGTYTNTWTVKDDCGNTSATFYQVISIQDTTAPIFTGNLPSDIEVSCDAVPEPAEMNVSDNCNENLPIVFSEVKSGIENDCPTNYTLTRTWKISDCGGNTTTHVQVITVRDKTAPTGTAPASVTNLASIDLIPVGNPSDITDEADNCSPTVNVTVVDTNNGGNGCDGTPYILTRTYTLTDCAGNKTELVQTFTIESKVTVSGVPTNTSCFGGTDGSIAVTSSPGSTVVITNERNEVVGNTNLPAGTYTLTATAPVNGENQICSATATVVITQPDYTVKISGKIINVDTNTPIANVPVTLIPQGTTTGPIQMRITGADGMYSFSGMPAGDYLVQVQDANLNSAYQLYPIDSSLFFTTLEDCKIQTHDFEYGSSNLPVLGDYVWYDTNSNGIQDEWYDANNDGVVTKNIPDSNGAVDYSLWEWIDLNGDGSYTGPQNNGELNAGGFGNALSANVIIDGPNGYHEEVIVGIEGFWRDRPAQANPYGDYTIKLVRDANFDTVAANLGFTGLVKVLPSISAKNIAGKTSKAQLHTVCKTTTDSGYIVTVTPEDLVHLDADFGVSCKEYKDIVANDDSAGPIAGVNTTTTNVLNVLTNDTLEGNPVTASEVIITTVTPNEFLQLNADGSVDVLPNAPVGTLTMVYQICEADQTDNCDTATVTITIEAPVMTVTATAICVNDVPYVDYVVTPGNFTPVNGVTIAWADSNNNVVTTMENLPLSGRVLWPGAVVDEQGKGIDWPGWIFENNRWIEAADGFEKLRPTANVTISVNPSQTITLSYPPADPYCTARPTFAIVANDDTPAPIITPTTQTTVGNVLTNDTLNGSAVNINDVTLTTTIPDPTGSITVNADGTISVAPNTQGGTYTLTYQICEKADFGNCDTAIVTVTIISPVVANDDTFSNIGCNTFGLVGNVLANDLKGRIAVTSELVNFTLVVEGNNTKTNPNITFDAVGNVTVSSLTPAGTYTYNYTICDKSSPENCDSATITIIVVPNGVIQVSGTACNDDSTLVNLSSLLPEGTPTTGVWHDRNTTNALQGGILNPFGLALGNYAFEYVIADERCPRSIVLNMEINDDCRVLACGNVVVHNAFSPNGDSINDFFKIDNIDDTTCYPGNTVEIYNRWGILVFETTNYNNTTNAFDGTSRGRTTVKQSDGLPTGTYFYIITYKALDGNNNVQDHKLNGYLYLSKNN